MMVVRLLIILALALLGGCHRGGDIDKTISPVEFSFAEGCNTEPLFTDKGGSADIEFISGYEWIASPAEEWVEVTPPSGTARDGKFTIHCHPSNEGEDRECLVTIYLSNEEQHFVTVRQLHKDIFEAECDEEIEVAPEGETISINISTNIEYTLEVPSSAQSWITPLASRAMRDEILSITVAENHYFTSRQAQLKLLDKEGNVLKIFKIKQLAAKCDPNEIFYTSTDGKMINLQTVNGFGATVISHNYDYGYGSIRCDGNITSIPDNAFNNCSTLVTITLPSQLEKVGNFAFENCSSLVEIEFPSTLKSIGNYAFSRCVGLGSISLTQGVTTIGNFAFNGCSDITNVSIAPSVNTIGISAFKECSKLVGVHISDLEAWCNITFGDAAANPLSLARYFYFNGGEMLKLEIPSSITEIKDYTFYGYDGAQEITLHSDIGPIGISAFAECTGKLTVNCNIPNCDSEENGAFVGSNFTEVTINEGVKYIGSYAFAGCSTIRKIALPESLLLIGSNSFNGCKSLTSIAIPQEVKVCGKGAFEGCESLREVHISDLTAWFGISFGDATANPIYYTKGLHLNDTKLTHIELPQTVTKIGDYALYNCQSLSNITLHNNITAIGNSSFEGCSGLTSLTLPTSLTSFGSSPFAECTGDLVVKCDLPSATSSANSPLHNSKFSRVTIAEGVKKIGDYALYNCSSIAQISIAKSVEEIGSYALYGCRGEIRIDCNIPSAASEFDSIFYGASFDEITIGREVATIGGGAFTGCTGTLIVECEIPSASTASEGAFYGASVSKVVIGNDVTSIGDYAFRGCSKIEEVTFGQSVKNIGSYAFANCNALREIRLPQSVESIDRMAFYNCNSLVRTELGAGITTLSKHAFYGCSGEIIVNGNLPAAASTNESAFNGARFAKATISGSATTIRSYTFGGCSTLANVTLGEGVSTIEKNAFEGCSSLTALHLRSTTPPAIYYYSAQKSDKSIPENEGLQIYVPSSALSAYTAYNAGSPNNTAIENWYFYRGYIKAE
jgi:hypothetical protein